MEKGSLRAARPYVELAGGHVHADEAADVKLDIRGVGPVIQQKQVLHHDVNYVSPRLGVEIPLDANDSLSLQAGYLFFDKHASDFNNVSIYFMHSHRF